jgi:hypothetical protein
LILFGLGEGLALGLALRVRRPFDNASQRMQTRSIALRQTRDRALEKAGAVFIDEKGDGVRLKKKSDTRRRTYSSIPKAAARLSRTQSKT